MADVPSAAGKDPSAVRGALSTLRRVYGGKAQDPYYVSSIGTAEQVELVMGDAGAATYGEIPPVGFVQLLNFVQAKPCQLFYDLGSGTGKTVILAWLLGLRATGIELVQERHNAACEALERLKQDRGPCDGLQLIKASCLDVDWTDADILFCYDLCFPAAARQSIAGIARRLRPGAVVVTSLAGELDEGFKLVDTFGCAASWGNRDIYFKVWSVAPGA